MTLIISNIQKNMLVVSLKDVHNRSGVYNDDDEFIRDMKISNWIGTQSCRCVEYDEHAYQSHIDQAQRDGIEILIFKGEVNVTKS